MAKLIAKIDCPDCGRDADVKEEVRGKTLYIRCEHTDCKYHCTRRGAAAQARLRALVDGAPVETTISDDGVFTPDDAVPTVVADAVDDAVDKASNVVTIKRASGIGVLLLGVGALVWGLKR